jgi:hypothetical protein
MNSEQLIRGGRERKKTILPNEEGEMKKRD